MVQNGKAHRSFRLSATSASSALGSNMNGTVCNRNIRTINMVSHWEITYALPLNIDLLIELLDPDKDLVRSALCSGWRRMELRPILGSSLSCDRVELIDPSSLKSQSRDSVSSCLGPGLLNINIYRESQKTWELEDDLVTFKRHFRKNER